MSTHNPPSTVRRKCLVLALLAACGLPAAVARAGDDKPADGAAAPAPTPAAAGTQRLKVEPEILDFGNTYDGEEARGSLKLTNTGDAPLMIYDIKKSCGCTVVQLKDKQLQPGESVDVAVSMRPRSSQHGSTFNRRVTIVSDDPAEPSKGVELTTRVIKPMLVEPERLTLTDILAEDTSTTRVDISATEDVEFAITGVTIQEGVPIRADAKLNEKSKAHQLELVVGPLTGGNDLSVTVILQTDHPQASEVRIPVIAKVARPVIINPRRIVLGNVKPGTSVTKQLRVISRPGYEVTKMDLLITRHPEVKVTATPSPASENLWDLKFDIPLDYAGKSLNSQITVSTNVPNAGSLDMTISARVDDRIDLAPELPRGG